MAYNIFQPNSQTPAYRASAGGAVLQTAPVLAVVKNNRDANRTGQLQVLVISDAPASDPNDSTRWQTVYYSSPYFGVTEGNNATTGLGNFTQNPHSYGMWCPAPDIGTLVLCVFVEGRPNLGFVIASVPRAEALSMLPAIGASDSVTLNAEEAASFGGARRLPTVNINPRNANSEGANYYSQPRPVHSYQAAILHQQGLTRDEIRGTVGSNAQRESPSRVFGISTPGRAIYEGGYTDETIVRAAEKPDASTRVIARRGGHTLVMDDGDIRGRDNLVRLRTANGHTILMSDDGQTLFIMHSNGHSWIELGKEGTIDMYATNSVNIRTMGDLNLHADKDVNINAGKRVNIAGQDMSLQSETNMTQRSGADLSVQAGGQYGVKVEGAMSFAAAGEAGVKGARVFIEGQPVNLNSGSPSFVPGAVKSLPITQHPDAVWSSDKGWLSTPLKLPSIVSRAPSHQPWPLGNTGVNVEVKMTEQSALPAAPRPAAQAANTAAASTPSPPRPAPGASATVPTANATAAAQAATNAAQPASPATTGVAKITPQQAEAAGYITRGSAAVVQKLLDQGKPVPNNLMTGRDGMDTWDKFTKNPAAQAAAVSGSVADAARQLAKTGAMTGREDPKTVAGITLAGAATGVRTVTEYLQRAQTVSGLTPGLGNNINTALTSLGTVQNILGGANRVAGLISGGNQAAAAADGLSGLKTAITGQLGTTARGLLGGFTKTWETIKGTVTGMFASVKSALPGLKPDQPQNLREIADTAQAKAQSAQGSAAETGLLGTLTGGVKTLVGGVGRGITSAIDRVKTAFTGTAGTASASASAGVSLPTSVDAAVTASSAAATAAQNSTASGLAGVPGRLAAAVGLPNIPNPIAALGSGVNKLVDQARAGLGTLRNLLKTGLPAATANKVEATLAAANTSDQQVKAPEAAENTNDATQAVSGSVSRLLGRQVPLPPTGTPIEGYNPRLVAPEADVPDRVALAQAQAAAAPTVDKQIADIERTLSEQQQYDARLQARVEAGTATAADLRLVKENADSRQYFTDRLSQLRGQASLASRAATSAAQDREQG